VCCSVLQFVAAWMSCGYCICVLQCVAVCCSVLQCVAVCCSVLQCVVACCSVLQYVAVRFSVSRCVAVCCSVLHHGYVVWELYMWHESLETPAWECLYVAWVCGIWCVIDYTTTYRHMIRYIDTYR